MQVSVISFSARSAGNCQAIAHAVAAQHTGDDVRLFLFSDLSTHACGACNYECFHPSRSCPHMGDGIPAIYEAVTQSALSYFIVPNYCDYPNANYFLFCERSQCFFQRRPALYDRYLAVPKRFIVVSNTQKENFLRIFQDQIPPSNTPDVLFLAAQAYQKVSIAGDLLTSDAALRDVQAFCASPVKLNPKSY